ncbi:MAG: hypothetical protein J2P37_15445 [Ktedonobacteraceae bacterium]|nr:hypothetical protein [Ktedonobacteraceae bacterium]
MSSTQLEYAEQRMQQKWYDLAMAEQQGASTQVLERLYNAYMLAVEEFNRCSAEQQEAQIHPPKKSSRQMHGRKKKAS